MPSPTRLVLAVVRAGVPIVGSFLLGWTLWNILFFFWFELVTAGLYITTLALREIAGRPRTANARWLSEAIYVAVASQLPAIIVAVIVANVVGAEDTWDLVSALVRQPDMRIAIALQLVLALVGALRWSQKHDPAFAEAESVIDLQFSRMIVVGASLIPMLLILVLVAALVPEPLQAVVAERTLVVIYATLWAAGDAAPERFYRFAQWLMKKSNSGRHR